jgi:hypothetical protein
VFSIIALPLHGFKPLRGGVKDATILFMMTDDDNKSPIPFETSEDLPAGEAALIPAEASDSSPDTAGGAPDEEFAGMVVETAESSAPDPELEISEADEVGAVTDDTEVRVRNDAATDELNEDAALSDLAAAVNFDDLVDTSFDVEAALNALMVADMTVAPLEDETTQFGDDETSVMRPTVTSYAPVNYTPNLSMPAPTMLKRGSPGSVIPALFLIGSGAWWTITSAAGIPPDPLLVVAAIVGGLVVILLAQWLGSGRWGRGYLFFALVIAFSAVILLIATQTNTINLVRGYPLFVIGIGAAALLSAVLARPVDRRLFAPSILLMVAGLLGLVVTSGAFPASALTTAAAFAPILAVILIILWVLPLIVRRRN